MEWLNKIWYQKLIDILLLLGGMSGLFSIVLVWIKSLKKHGSKPQIINDKGKWMFTVTDDDGHIKNINNEEFTLLLIEKDKKIKDLTSSVYELQTRLSLLEFDVQKTKLISDYQKAHSIPMSEHLVFFNLKRLIEGGVPLQLSNDNHVIRAKQEIAKIFIEECKLPVFYTRLKEFIHSFDVIKDDSERLSHLYSIITYLYSWIEEYSIKAATCKVSLSDGRSFYGIPDSFIDKFNEWHNPHVDIVVKKIKDVLYSEFYGTWRLKLIVILDHIDTAFYLTVQDAEKTIETINGKVEKQIRDKLTNL